MKKMDEILLEIVLRKPSRFLNVRAIKIGSRKPFKSGEKVNTITGLTTNPNTQKPAFRFKEDESVVDCRTLGVESVCLDCKHIQFNKVSDHCLTFCESCKENKFFDLINFGR